MKKNKINWQIFISIYISLSFIVMAFTGVVLFFAPHGRVANWSYWSFLGLQKQDWQAVHTVFTFLFVIAAIFHLYFNWNAVKLYLTSKISASLKYGREIFASSVIVTLLFAGSALGLPPFENLMDFGEFLSESWSNAGTEPPVPHAEEMSLKELAITLKSDEKVLIANLEKAGIYVISGDEIIKDIANRNQTTPSDIYGVINKDYNSYAHIQSGIGGGYGRMTIEELCKNNGITTSDGLRRLMAKGMPAEADSKIKDVAYDHKMQPVSVAEIIIDKKLIAEGK